MNDGLDFLLDKYQQGLALEDTRVRFAALITVDAEGFPTTRFVTIRSFTRAGISISVSGDSPKIKHLMSNGKWELAGFWPLQLFQYRIRGTYEIRCGENERATWYMKPEASRVLDVYHENVRPQSTPLASREQLLEEVATLRRNIAAGLTPLEAKKVSCLWLSPTLIETWEGSDDDRLHDRSVWKLCESKWVRTRLVP
jgi:pyridoxamine 5'-phosphate oxidase